MYFMKTEDIFQWKFNGHYPGCYMNNEVSVLSVGVSEGPQIIWQTDDSSANMPAGSSVFCYQYNREYTPKKN